MPLHGHTISGAARHLQWGGTLSEGPPNFSGGPLTQFQFSPPISATSFCNYNNVFFAKFCQKSVQMPVEGPLTSQGSPPNFNFLLGLRSLHFANMLKRFFVKFCKKKLKCRTCGAPDMRWGGGNVPPVPPGCATASDLFFIVLCTLPHSHVR